MRKILFFLLYSAILFSFLTAKILAIDLGTFQLSLYRISLLLLIIVFISIALKTEQNTKIILKKEHKYSIQFHFVWILYATLSLFWIKDFSSWVYAMYFLFTGIFMIFISSIFLIHKNQITKAFHLMGFMIIIHNFIGWYEIVTRNYHFIDAYNQAFYANNFYRIPISLAGNPNDYALLVAFGVGILYVCLKNSRKKFSKIICLIAMISSIVLIFMTQSRGVAVGFLMGVMFFSLMILKSQKPLHKGLFASGLVLLCFIILNDKLIMEYVDSYLWFDFATRGSDVTRMNLIKNGFFFFGQTLGFGTGAGNLEFWMGNRAIYPVGKILNMHNWWVELLSTYGFFIFVSYLVFYKKLFSSMYRNFEHSLNVESKNISLGIMYCMIVFLIGSVSSSSNLSSEWLWVFWGVAIAFQGQSG